MQIAVATLIAVLLCNARIAAQEVAPLLLPARVRILAPPLLTVPTVGTATAGSQHMLGLALADRDTLEIPIAAIRRIEVSRGMRRETRRGVIIGLITGVGATAGFLALFCGGDTLCEADEFLRAYAIIGIPPVIVFGGIGALVRTERWKSIPPDKLQFTTQ